MKEISAVDVIAKSMWALRLGAYILAVYGVIQSMAILLGGVGRFSAPGYYYALQVPGAPPTWGLVLLPASVAAVWGVRTSSYRVARFAFYAMALWSAFFAISFLLSAVNSPTANFTAIAVYGKDAVMFILVAEFYRRHRRNKAAASR